MVKVIGDPAGKDVPLSVSTVTSISVSAHPTPVFAVSAGSAVETLTEALG
ncbi:MAG: hypothetical protein ACJAY5_000030 [Actinomycetes bacterium]|jgi:hypothetical protein